MLSCTVRRRGSGFDMIISDVHVYSKDLVTTHSGEAGILIVVRCGLEELLVTTYRTFLSDWVISRAEYCA